MIAWKWKVDVEYLSLAAFPFAASSIIVHYILYRLEVRRSGCRKIDRQSGQSVPLANRRVPISNKGIDFIL